MFLGAVRDSTHPLGHGLVLEVDTIEAMEERMCNPPPPRCGHDRTQHQTMLNRTPS